jgi:hypothetical protein
MLSPRARATLSSPDEVPADDEGLREALGLRLHGVLDADAELRAVAEQALEAVLILGRRDDQDLRMPASMSVESG